MQALRLRCAEFERLRAEDAASIRRLGIKLRRLEAAAKTVTATSVDLRAPSATPSSCSAGTRSESATP